MVLKSLILITMLVASVAPVREERKNNVMKCDLAQSKCAYREGCGMALRNYMIECADVISGRTRRCSDLCQKSLIALTSTNEGKNLMDCECGHDEFCLTSKRRVERVCRDSVSEAIDDRSVVSCSVAQWICSADPVCRTALEYYHHYCHAMFHGVKCSNRCNNSRSILDRQEKAEKLRTCYCDGTEPYNCVKIRQNMDRLCFGRTELIDYTWKGVSGARNPGNGESNEIPNFPNGTSTQTIAVLVLLTSLISSYIAFLAPG